MDFPRLVYRMNRKELEWHCVEDAPAYNNALALDWYSTVPDAMNPPKREEAEEQVNEKGQEEPKEAEEAPPTREEIEAKCDELGIPHDKRYKDKRLLDLIEEKLKG